MELLSQFNRSFKWRDDLREICYTTVRRVRFEITPWPTFGRSPRSSGGVNSLPLLQCLTYSVLGEHFMALLQKCQCEINDPKNRGWTSRLQVSGRKIYTFRIIMGPDLRQRAKTKHQTDRSTTDMQVVLYTFFPLWIGSRFILTRTPLGVEYLSPWLCLITLFLWRRWRNMTQHIQPSTINFCHTTHTHSQHDIQTMQKTCIKNDKRSRINRQRH